jgi:hypothetical protein
MPGSREGGHGREIGGCMTGGEVGEAPRRGGAETGVAATKGRVGDKLRASHAGLGISCDDSCTEGGGRGGSESEGPGLPEGGGGQWSASLDSGGSSKRGCSGEKSPDGAPMGARKSGREGAVARTGVERVCSRSAAAKAGRSSRP